MRTATTCFLHRLKPESFLLGLLALLGFLYPVQSVRAYIEFSYAANFQSIRMPLLPRGAEPWEKGDTDFAISASWMNVWSIQSDRFILDGEELQFQAALSYGLSDRFRIGISVPYFIQGGGVLDSSIEDFHSTFGVTQGQRDRFPRNTFNVSYEPLGPYYPYLMRLERLLLGSEIPRLYPRSPYDPPVDLDLTLEDAAALGVEPQWFPEDSLGAENRSGPGGVGFFLDYQFPLSGKLGPLELHSAVVSVQYRFEGAPSVVAGNTGAALSTSVVLRSEKKPHSTYWNLGLSYTAFEDRQFRLLELPAQQWSFRPRVGYTTRDSDFFLEYVYLGRPVKDFGRLSEDGHQIALGFGTKAGPFRLEMALVENLITYSTTPDVGFYLALRRKL